MTDARRAVPRSGSVLGDPYERACLVAKASGDDPHLIALVRRVLAT